jgi:DNA-binding NarL/FixJ family response regulator
MPVPPSIRIVVADDHPLFREGLRYLLAAEPGFDVVGEATDGEEALRLCAALAPDIVLLDVDMPRLTGLEVLTRLRDAAGTTGALIVTAAVERRTMLEAVMLGARGVLLKTAPPDVLVQSIREVAAGGCWIEHAAIDDLVAALRGSGSPASMAEGVRLTPREQQIVSAITGGASNSDIGRTFGLRDQTVKNHLTRIYEKTGVASRLELALFALSHGLASEAASARVPPPEPTLPRFQRPAVLSRPVSGETRT